MLSCCCRLAALSDGHISGQGDIVCPYHGWEFNGEGRCTHNPQVRHWVRLLRMLSCCHVLAIVVEHTISAVIAQNTSAAASLSQAPDALGSGAADVYSE